jgi:O-antigen/teichoic acid export membrane protein
MVLGRTLGMEATGLFSRAMGYVQLFERLLQDVLRSVMLPYLAEEVRSGGDVRGKLQLAIANIAAVSLFIIGLTGVLAKPMIALLFGAQWIAAVPVAQVLCIAMAIRCMSPTLGAALVAKGAIAQVMRSSLVSSLAKFALLIALSGQGLMLAAIAFTMAEAIGLAVLLYYSSRNGVFLWSDYLRVMSKSVPLAVAGLLPAIGMQLALVPPNTELAIMMHLAAAGTGSCLLWLVLVWVADSPPKAELSRLIDVVRTRLG